MRKERLRGIKEHDTEKWINNEKERIQVEVEMEEKINREKKEKEY